MSKKETGKIYQLKVDGDQEKKQDGILWLDDRTARLVAILDSQPDCVKVIDKDGLLVDMNPAGLKMIAAPSLEAMRGSKVIDLVDDIYKDLFSETIEAVFKGETRHIEFNITSLDGTKRRMSQRCAPIFNKDDPRIVDEMVAVTRDITERYNTTRELVEAKAVAEEAYRVKSSFLATMSHELRTPLNAILGFSEIMKDEQFGEIGNNKYREYIKDIYGSGKHLLELINDVLDISEIEAKKRILHKERIDIRDTIDYCITTVGVLAEQKDIDIGVNAADIVQEICADRRSIKQILINLLSNAIKFSSKGGNIVLKTATTKKHLVISVKDTGVGISKENLEKLTRPFFRIQDNAEIATPGTGLGLSIVQSLVDAHDGKLKFDSEMNKGTQVKIYLPLELNCESCSGKA